MARSKRIVINAKKIGTDRLPEWANEGAVLVQGLHERGVLDGIGGRLQIQREGGYVGLDLVLFLLFFLTSKLPGGIKGFAERMAPHRQQLGALGGRRRLPSPSSVSRIFGAVLPSHAEEIAQWLLVEACGAKPLLRHPAVATRDALGESWQVFDVDPKTTVLRQRGLPEFDDMPPAQRRAIEARPGYPGRKRGDVQVSRMTLQHAGSSLWLGLWMAPGNGEWRTHSEAAVQRVRSICNGVGFAPERALVRVDGAGGNVPLITACQDAGVHYLTRWSRYEMLDESDVRSELNAACWFAVADSGSGPHRQAADLGWMTLWPSDSTVREDGSAYAPVRARIVVSRFQAQEADKKRGAGRLIDGWQYELYATDLPADAWPAHDVVTTYYGRCGQENRFHQENQEIGLDHIFSYGVAGQQLANLVGLFLWNLRVCGGFELADVPDECPPQPPRLAADVKAGVQLIVEEAADSVVADPESVGCEVPSETAPIVDEPVADTTEELGSVPHAAAIAATIGETTALPAESSAPQPGDLVTRRAREEAGGALLQALDSLDWEQHLESRPGWRWDPKDGLMCPNGEVHKLQSVKIRGRDRTRQLRFYAPYSACGACPLRAGCSPSTEEGFRKETAVTVPTPTAHPIHQLHELIHRRPEPPPPKTVAPVSPSPRRPPKLPPTSRPSVAKAPASCAAPREASWQQPGGFAVTAALLLPAKMRRLLARACRELDVHVRLKLPDRTDPPTVFALTAAERQSRRLTWAQRLARNTLPDGSEVRIVFAGSDELDSLLRRDADPERGSKAA